ncbi:hypothetical protein L1887_05762 [Cichorium endivia]|nr:hypothetical protein L1887_05762 [Cichorium endivia]
MCVSKRNYKTDGEASTTYFPVSVPTKHEEDECSGKLKDFIEWFGLRDMLRFNTRVEYVEMLDYGEFGKDLSWVVESKGFPFLESQAKWIAQLLSGKRILPSRDELMKFIQEFYKAREAAGIPKHDTYDLPKFEYCDRYADYVGFPHLEEWRKDFCISPLVNSYVNLETSRDYYDDEELLQVAHQNPHFTQLEAGDFSSM